MTGTDLPADRRSRSAERVLDVLDVLQDATGSLPLHELARRTGMHKPTALRYLATLVARRYVERDVVTGEYRLGVAGPIHGRVYERLVRVARPSLERIGKRFEETTALAVLAHDRIAGLDLIDSPHPIRLVADLGQREHVHSTALGKAIAATLPPDAVRAIVESSGMPAHTPTTIVDIDKLLEHLEHVRDCGYAIGDQENDPWSRGVAVALPTARVRAAVGISAPTMRFELADAPDVAAVLREEAAAIASAFDADPVRPDQPSTKTS